MDLLDGFTHLFDRTSGVLAVGLRISLVALDLALDLVNLFVELLGLGDETGKLVLDPAEITGVANAAHGEIRERECHEHAERATDENEGIQGVMTSPDDWASSRRVAYRLRSYRRPLLPEWK